MKVISAQPSTGVPWRSAGRYSHARTWRMMSRLKSSSGVGGVQLDETGAPGRIDEDAHRHLHAAHGARGVPVRHDGPRHGRHVSIALASARPLVPGTDPHPAPGGRRRRADGEQFRGHFDLRLPDLDLGHVDGEDGPRRRRDLDPAGHGNPERPQAAPAGGEIGIHAGPGRPLELGRRAHPREEEERVQKRRKACRGAEASIPIRRSGLDPTSNRHQVSASHG